jgi:hypothetical protein
MTRRLLVYAVATDLRDLFKSKCSSFSLARRAGISASAAVRQLEFIVAWLAEAIHRVRPRIEHGFQPAARSRPISIRDSAGLPIDLGPDTPPSLFGLADKEIE